MNEEELWRYVHNGVTPVGGVHFLDRLRFEMQAHAIAERMAKNFERKMAWYEPTGWRLALGLLVCTLVLPVFVLAAFREVALVWSDLGAWERARAVLVSIYLAIFAALWCWGVGMVTL